MATLTINGRTVTADVEQTILDAARSAGIMDIPTLCWYPKVPIVGNCRICLVSVEGQLPLTLHRYEADAAVADDRHLGIPAQRGDVHDAGAAGRVEDGLFDVGGDSAAVDREGRHAGLKIRADGGAGQPAA